MNHNTRTHQNNAIIFIMSLLLAFLLVTCSPQPPTVSSSGMLTSTVTFLPTSTPSLIGGGCIIFVAYRDGNPEMYVMNAEGSGVTNLSNNPEHDWAPDWSPLGGCEQTSSQVDPLEGTSWALIPR